MSLLMNDDRFRVVFRPWWKTTHTPIHGFRNKTQYIGAKWRILGTPTKRPERTEVANFHEISERAGHALCGLLRSDEGNPQGARQAPCARSKKGVSGMKIIKRSGSEVTFDINKIVNAIKGANGDVVPEERLTEDQIALAAHSVEWLCSRSGRHRVVEGSDMVGAPDHGLGHFSVSAQVHHLSLQPNAQAPVPTPTTRSCRSSSATTRKPSRRTRTRTPRSTPCSAITWQARCPRTLPCACSCRPTWWKPTTRASSTSTTPTTSRSICTTVTWSTWRTCASSTVISARSSSAAQLLHRVQHRHADHRPGGQLPVRRPVHLADAPCAVRRGQPPEDSSSGAAGDQRAGPRGQRRSHHRGRRGPSARRDPPRRANHPVPGGHDHDHQRPGAVRHRLHVPQRGAQRSGSATLP